MRGSSTKAPIVYNSLVHGMKMQLISCESKVLSSDSHRMHGELFQ